MDFVAKNVRPDSIFKMLRQQVEEQSELCDITIKVGKWVRKFHKCVLVASPFFHSVFNNDFLERKTGTVEIKFGSFFNVEAAILFLYGKHQKVTLDNAYELIGLAEFLLIPNLKASCIESLQQIEVNDENCWTLLQIASVYNFHLSRCQNYIDGHLSELLQTEKSLSIDGESVELILTDEKYSYVLMDDKLLFLLKWAANVPERVNILPRLLKCIDMRDIDTNVLEEIKGNNKLRLLFDVYCSVPNDSERNHMLQSVLIFQNPDDSKVLWMYSPVKERWFQLNMKETSNSDLNSYSFAKICGVVATSACEIYLHRNSYENMVFKHNLSNNEMLCLTLLDENGGKLERHDAISFTQHTVFTIGNKIITKIKQVNHYINHLQPNPNDLKSIQSQLMLHFGDSSFNSLQPNKNVWAERNSIQTSTLYKGQIDVAGNVKMIPVIVLLNETIKKVCASNTSVAMLCTASKNVFIYDTRSCQLEKIELSKQCVSYNLNSYDHICMAAKEDGFVIYTNVYVIDISHRTGPNLLPNYKIHEINLETNMSWHYVYYKYCENHWYRFVKKDNEENTEFQVCPHDQMKYGCFNDSNQWKSLPLPSSCFKSSFSTRNLYMVSLPKHKVRCPINCCHCKPINSEDVSRYMSYYYDRDVDYCHDDYDYNCDSDDDYCHDDYYSNDITSYDTCDDYYYNSD